MKKDGIKVLSLFDGMSCGRIALEELGIKVKEYYASEIDKHAISQAQFNFPGTFQIGDVTKVKAKDLPKIDLLLGGSPCQGFSFAGKQLAFDDPRSALFFEFVRLKEELKPKYWLLENVKMKKEHEAVITRYLGVKPITINSALVSAQNRVRKYWTNIANEPHGLFDDMKCMIPQPKDEGILLKHILEKDVPEKYFVSNKKMVEFITDQWRLEKKYTQLNGDKAITQQARQYSSWCGDYIVASRGINPEKPKSCEAGLNTEQMHPTKDARIRRLTPTECARLQTIPEWYQWQCSDTQAYRMLGNGWTIKVITHILSFMKL